MPCLYPNYNIMAFITKSDLDQDIYSEILTGITRANDAKIATACAEAQDEINGYVCARYDSAALFAITDPAEGEPATDTRNKTILALARTIAIYKLHKACNTMPELILVDYEMAIKTLDKIQSGKIILEGAKLVGQTETITPNTQVTRSGNIKRSNYM